MSWHWQRAMADADARASVGAVSPAAWNAHATLPHDLARRLLGLNDDIEYRGTATLAAELAASEVDAEDLQGARGGRDRAAADRGGHLGSPAREPRGRPARGPSLHRPSVPRPGGERIRRRPERANDTADAGAEGARAVPARCPARPRRRQRTAEPRADVAATCAAAAQERPARRRRRPRRAERGPVRRTPGTATDACT